MNASIKKEVRSLLPAVAVTILLTVGAAKLFSGHDSPGLVCTVFAFGGLLVGAGVFGREFQAKTIATLLTQPRRRQAIWTEKMSTLGIALLVGCGISLIAARFFLQVYAFEYEHFGATPYREFAYTMAAIVLVVFCTAPFATIVSRSVL